MKQSKDKRLKKKKEISECNHKMTNHWWCKWDSGQIKVESFKIKLYLFCLLISCLSSFSLLLLLLLVVFFFCCLFFSLIFLSFYSFVTHFCLKPFVPIINLMTISLEFNWINSIEFLNTNFSIWTFVIQIDFGFDKFSYFDLMA